MYFVNLIHKYGNIGIQPSFIIMLFLISAEKNRDLKIVDIEIRQFCSFQFANVVDNCKSLFYTFYRVFTYFKRCDFNFSRRILFSLRNQPQLLRSIMTYTSHLNFLLFVIPSCLSSLPKNELSLDAELCSLSTASILIRVAGLSSSIYST